MLGKKTKQLFLSLTALVTLLTPVLGNIVPVIAVGTSGYIFLSAPKASAQASNAEDDKATCEASGLSFSWLFCALINSLAEASEGIFDTFVKPFLESQPVDTDPNKPVYKAWSNFRVIANILLVIALIIAVYGQAIGGGLIDAYTAKKIVPRLLISAILINLSIYVVALLVDLTNVAGEGIGKLITAPFAINDYLTIKPNFVINAGGIAAFVLSLWALGAVAGAALQFFLVFILLPGFLAMVGAFVTLIIRQGIILFLIIISPVAFALYVLPNTEKYFRQWWSLLAKTLLVYPLVIVIFAVANIIAVTIAGANTSSGSRASISQLAAFVVMFMPLFLIPFAFKLAGGAIATIAGALSGQGKAFGEFVKGNANDPNSIRNRSKRNLAEQATRRQASIAHAGRGVKDTDKSFRGRRLRTAGRFADMFGNVDQRISGYNKAALERREALSNTGNDDLIYAGAGYYDKASGEYRDAKGRPISKQTYDVGKRLYGNSMHDIQTGLGYALQKAQTDEDLGAFREAFTQNAIKENWNQDEAMGVWAGATYPHKGTHASEWYSAPEVQLGTDGRTAGVSYKDVSTNIDSMDKMVKDLHKTREAFRLGSVRDVDWRAIYSRRSGIENQISAQGINSVSQKDLEFFAQSDEILEAMVHTPGSGVTLDQEGNISVAGASAASQGVISAMYKNRKYGASQARQQLPNGTYAYSGNARTIYDVAAVKAATTSRPGVRPMDKDAAIAQHSLGRTVDVTGDEQRSKIPK